MVSHAGAWVSSNDLTTKPRLLKGIIPRSTTPPITATPGKLYAYDVQATDPDGGKLVYTLDQTSLNKGMTLDELGRLRWTPTTAQVGAHAVTLTITDGAGASITQPIALTVASDTQAPLVKLKVGGLVPPNLGDSLTFAVSASDDVGVQSIKLTVNGQAVAIDSRSQATIVFNQPGAVAVVAQVTDTAGNTQTDTVSFNVIDPTDVNAPTIALNLDDDTVFTSPTDITGTISDGNLDYYTLEVAPIGEETFREVFRGTGTVQNGVIAKFDPSTLQNDAYTLRVTAIDLSGNVTTAERVIDVQGNLKLGNFKLSFTDLEIPVSGIPISVSRTYDSLNAGVRDDLGYGWRLEFRDTDLRTSLRPDPVYEELGVRTQAFKQGTKVFITLPGGEAGGVYV